MNELFLITNNIPAWFVGFSGAALVLLSIAISSIRSAKIDAEIKKKRIASLDLGKKIDGRLDSFIRGNAQSISAEMLFGLFLSPIQSMQASAFLRERISKNLGEVYLTMMLAAGQDLPKDDTPLEELSCFQKRISRGDLTAFRELNGAIDGLRFKAKDALSELNKTRGKREREIASLEAKEKRVRHLATGLNLLGLIIVMLKDLPVWK